MAGPSKAAKSGKSSTASSSPKKNEQKKTSTTTGSSGSDSATNTPKRTLKRVSLDDQKGVQKKYKEPPVTEQHKSGRGPAGSSSSPASGPPATPSASRKTGSKIPENGSSGNSLPASSATLSASPGNAVKPVAPVIQQEMATDMAEPATTAKAAGTTGAAAPTGTAASTGPSSPEVSASKANQPLGIGARKPDPATLKTVANALTDAPVAVDEVPENDLVTVEQAPDGKTVTFTSVDGTSVTVTANDDGTQTFMVDSGVQAAKGGGPGNAGTTADTGVDAGAGGGVDDGNNTDAARTGDSLAVVTAEGQVVVVQFEEDSGQPDSISRVTIEDGAQVDKIVGNDGQNVVHNNGKISQVELKEGANETVNNGEIGVISRIAKGDDTETIVNNGSIESIAMTNSRTAIVNKKDGAIEYIGKKWPRYRPESDVKDGEEEVQVKNDGKIGSISLANGNDVVDNRVAGTIDTISMEGKENAVHNIGRIGSVAMEGDKNLVSGSGNITTSVSMAGKDNTVINSGTLGAVTLQGNESTIINNKVLGLLQLGHGEERVINRGEITSIELTGDRDTTEIENDLSGHIEAISVQDPAAWRDYVFNEGVTIKNQGTIDAVTLGDGADSLLNRGTMGGRVDTGEGNDSVINLGTITSLKTGKGADLVVTGPQAMIEQADTGADQDFVFVRQAGTVASLETGSGPDVVRNDGKINMLKDAGGEDIYLSGAEAPAGPDTSDFEHRYDYKIKDGQLSLIGERANAAVEDLLFVNTRDGHMDVGFGIDGAVMHPFNDIDTDGMKRRVSFAQVVYSPDGKKSATITPQTPAGKQVLNAKAPGDVVYVSHIHAPRPPKGYDPDTHATSEASTGTWKGEVFSSAQGYFTKRKEVQGVTVLVSDHIPEEEIGKVVFQLEQVTANLPVAVREKLKGLKVQLGGDLGDFAIPQIAQDSQPGVAHYDQQNKHINMTLLSVDAFLHEFGHALQDLAGDHVIARNKDTGQGVTLRDAIQNAFSTATNDESGWGTRNWNNPEDEYWAQGHEIGFSARANGADPGFNPQSPAELEYADPKLYAILQELYPGLFT